jgi:hypothetical protein
VLFVQVLSSLGDVERYWAAVYEILRRAREKSPTTSGNLHEFSPSCAARVWWRGTALTKAHRAAGVVRIGSPLVRPGPLG